MRRGLAIIGTALVAIAIAPARAGGDGLPVGAVDAGLSGVTSGGSRYVTLPARRDTVVAVVRRRDGVVLRSGLVPGRFTIPAVALDASAGGLSADGRTLVLIRPRRAFPRARTSFAVLGVRRLAVRKTVRLEGDFSFDALSPDGSRLYLIRYQSRRDPTRYEVRAYDLRRDRLLSTPIIDPREPDERMRGYPITRTTSPDGRWAYTLYDRAGGHPFVHALDTVDGDAVCIDLDALAGRRDLAQMKLVLDGRELTVRGGRGPVVLVDRATFRVRAPAAAPRRPAAAPARDDEPPWTLIATAAGALLLAAGAGLAVRRQGRGGAVAA